ncbi:hypothetical protein RRG08_058632 [Elysia crispata]|uniref:Uncharacterized protein n=1 Tax=Elysia crispata TaxID=231223 RepID=A0AAE1D7T0_9GAST|nr:hypothetical protein RRG08_058632 [Elysia crispata]
MLITSDRTQTRLTRLPITWYTRPLTLDHFLVFDVRTVSTLQLDSYGIFETLLDLVHSQQGKLPDKLPSVLVRFEPTTEDLCRDHASGLACSHRHSTSWHTVRPVCMENGGS